MGIQWRGGAKRLGTTTEPGFGGGPGFSGCLGVSQVVSHPSTHGGHDVAGRPHREQSVGLRHEVLASPAVATGPALL